MLLVYASLVSILPGLSGGRTGVYAGRCGVKRVQGRMQAGVGVKRGQGRMQAGVGEKRALPLTHHKICNVKFRIYARPTLL